MIKIADNDIAENGYTTKDGKLLSTDFARESVREALNRIASARSDDIPNDMNTATGRWAYMIAGTVTILRELGLEYSQASALTNMLTEELVRMGMKHGE